MLSHVYNFVYKFATYIIYLTHSCTDVYMLQHVNDLFINVIELTKLKDFTIWSDFNFNTITGIPEYMLISSIVRNKMCFTFTLNFNKFTNFAL